MKCRECECCRKGWFKYMPNAYVCIGVPEPFVIRDINVECTEYPERRNKAVENSNIKDAIEHFKYGIDYDVFSEPVTSYAKMAVEALEKQIPKIVIKHGDDESDYVYCPCCNECIGSNEIVYDDFYYMNWSPMHCQVCGQAMIWE